MTQLPSYANLSEIADTFRSGDFDYLSTAQFYELFDVEWRNITKSFLKLEVAPVYVEDGDESFDAFASGEIEKAAGIVAHRVLEQKDMYRDVLDRGAVISRLRVIGRPVTPYIWEYEMPAYRAARTIGEDVRFIDEALMTTEQQRIVQDILIFDQSCILMHDYSPWGRLLGAWVSRSEPIVKEYYKLWHDLEPVATPYPAWSERLRLRASPNSF